MSVDNELVGLTLGPAVAAPKLVRDSDDRLPTDLPCVCRPGGERYYAAGILGRGAYGVVLRYDSTRNGLPLAVKIIRGGTARRQEDLACQVPPCRGVLPQVRLTAGDEWLDVEESPRWSPHVSTDWAFYAMPCMDRDVLHLPDAADPPGRAAEVVAAMARGLARLHVAGYRYYDVKPNNMLVDRWGGMHLGDLSSVASRASTYPPPVCLRDRFPWYELDQGFVRGPRRETYALNTAWALIVCFLIVAIPGRSIKVGGKMRSVSRILGFSSPIVCEASDDWPLRSVEKLLETVGTDAALVLLTILSQISRGRLPGLPGTLQTVGQLG
jgi:serine/threonine protein kinase